MTSSFNITVYCGATDVCDPKFIHLASDLGEFIGKNQWSLYFGAGRIGLMGAIAKACLKAGGAVHGIGFENEFLKQTEPAFEGLTSLTIEETIHQRKHKLHTAADMIVILPGGIGTLDEFMEALTWQYLGINSAPILIVNAFGYWDTLIQLLAHIQKERFLKDITRINYHCVTSLTEAKAYIKAHAASPSSPVA